MAAGAESLPSPPPGGPGRVVSSRVRAAGEAPAGAGGSARSAASRAARVRARVGSAAGRAHPLRGARPRTAPGGERAPRGAFAARGFLARSPAPPSRGGFVFAASLISARREFDPFWTHLTVTFYG